MKNGARSWIEKSPYGVSMGVQVEEITETSVRLRLPYRDDNSNPGKVLHGGVTASMIAFSAGAVSRLVLGAEAGPFHTAAVQVDYLSAAIGEPIQAEAVLLRTGKEICFSRVRVETNLRKPVAEALAMVHARHCSDEPERPRATGDGGQQTPAPPGLRLRQLPFISKLGLQIEHMGDSRARIVLPWKDGNADESGGVHEGAVLALLDTAGAMASLALSGSATRKASTPGIQARILAPPPCADLVAYGCVAHRDHSLFFTEVEIAERATTQIVAQGTVLYRILTG
jgi:uncharacterized protein (TIGR00369 family)